MTVGAPRKDRISEKKTDSVVTGRRCAGIYTDVHHQNSLRVTATKQKKNGFHKTHSSKEDDDVTCAILPSGAIRDVCLDAPTSLNLAVLYSLPSVAFHVKLRVSGHRCAVGQYAVRCRSITKIKHHSCYELANARFRLRRFCAIRRRRRPTAAADRIDEPRPRRRRRRSQSRDRLTRDGEGRLRAKFIAPSTIAELRAVINDHSEAPG